MAFQLDTTPSPPNLNYKVYRRSESYRYDALGRRVWQQMIWDTAQNSCFDHDRSSGCRNEVTRTVWDGDQMLYEIRAGADTVGLGSENDNAGGVFNGRVGYTHASGIDAPLDLFKGSDVVVLYTDWRGRFDKGTCPASACDPSVYYFAGASENMYQDVALLADGPPSWYGNLTAELRDGSGYQYKRNRYYDPVTGRFTQEDPIGLAGGAHVYGFSKGDPANFSDPFGLCPPIDNNPYDCPGNMGALVMLGQMAPAMNRELAMFLPRNATAAATGVAVESVIGRVVGWVAGRFVGRAVTANEELITLYHRGNLAGGRVLATRSLSTSMSPDLAHYAPEEVLQTFKIPRSVFQAWDKAGYVTRYTDIYRGIVTHEIRIEAGASGELNKYLIKP